MRSRSIRPFALVLAVSAPVAARAQVPGLSYAPRADFDLDRTGPISICSARFDLDGDLDLTTADRGDHLDATSIVPLNDGGNRPGVSILHHGRPAPLAYCTARVHSLRCAPAISSSGTPSDSSARPVTIGD